MNNQDRKRAIIKLWLQIPSRERTRNHVLAFYALLEKERRKLIPDTRGGKDSYQLVQAWLTAYIE